MLKNFTKTAATITACVSLSFCAAFSGTILGSSLTSEQQSTIQTSITDTSIVETSMTLTSTQTKTIAQIAAAASPSVVEITTETVVTGSRMGQYVTQGAGSGVIISGDGYIVTNNHVIADSTKISVRLHDGTSYDTTLIGKDSHTDLAVIKINASGLTPASFGSSASLSVGEDAIAIGNPLGELGGTVTNGIISALDREIVIDGETMTLLQTNAAINPGNSGGGLFNSKGELVGIVNAKSAGEDVEGLGFAIPIDIARPVITELMANGYVSGRPSLGVTLVDISDSATAMRYRVSQLGVYVYQVDNNAQLQSGDLIKAVGTTAVNSSTEVKTAINAYKAGDTVSITIVRNGSQQSVSITLSELKS